MKKQSNELFEIVQKLYHSKFKKIFLINTNYKLEIELD